MLVGNRSRDSRKVAQSCYQLLWRYHHPQQQQSHLFAARFDTTRLFEYGSSSSSSVRNYNVASTAAALKSSLFHHQKSLYGSSLFEGTRRWMGASNKHNKKKRIEKCDIDPNGPKREPKFTVAMKKDYERIEQWFVQKLDHERPGRNRGIECARQIVLDENIEKKASTATGNLYLNTWIYRRFCLPLGYTRFTDVPGVILANKLIREGTTVRFERYKDPKLIVVEMYRYPHVRPTETQIKYLKLDKAAEMTRDEAHQILNFDDDDEFLTPAEEMEENRIIERTMFAAHPHEDREERIRKRKS